MSALSGGQKVGKIENGGTLQFNNVNEKSAGNYTLTIYYNLGDPPSRNLFVSVKGGSGAELTASSTGDWNTLGTLSMTVSLSSGNNTIEMYNSSHGAPDIDRIVV
jgi:alpha-galactosidase